MGEVLFAWNWKNNFWVENFIEICKRFDEYLLTSSKDEEGIIINLGLN